MNISQFGNHYCCVCGFSPPLSGLFPFFVASVWICTNPSWKKIPSFKKPPSYIHMQTNLTSTSYKPMYTQNPNLIQMWSRKIINLLFFPLLDGIVMQHIFTHLPLTPSTPWHLHWVNKAWFRVVGKNLAWNALEVVRIIHRSYFQHLATNGTPKQSLQIHFEFEHQCLDPTLYVSENDSFNVILCNVEQLPC